MVIWTLHWFEHLFKLQYKFIFYFQKYIPFFTNLSLQLINLIQLRLA